MGKIIVIGLGPGNIGDLTLKAVETINNGNPVFLRTEKHPTVSYLVQKGLQYESYDYIYDTEENFEKVYETIVSDLLKQVEKHEVINYCVPGNPFVAEKTVSMLLEYKKRGELDLEIISGMSFIDPIISSLGFDPINGLKVIDGLDLDNQSVDINTDNIITQVYNKVVASEVKLKLMEIYNDDQEIYVIRGAGITGEERIEKIPLYQLDRLEWIDYLTSIYIPKLENNSKNRYDMNNLIKIMEKLRSKEGCPWDIKQTHKSLREYVIEEAYEVVDAIDREDIDGLIEELGDLLLQVVFHSEIGREEGYFNIWDVISSICTKLIHRHPHVFGEVNVTTAEEVKYNWDQIKNKEKNITSYTQRLKDVPKSLSALMKSYKIQERAADVGFDWDNIEGVIMKVEEELKEFLQEYRGNRSDNIEEEIGDLLFAIVNLARFINVNPEIALNKTIKKFIDRFEYMEKESKNQGKNLQSMKLQEMDLLWEHAKTHKIKKNDKK
jgi:tetrapyrrole methylase family protein/MazG family protein